MPTRKSALLCAASVAVTVMFAGAPGYAQTGAEWPSFGGNQLGTQYSTLTQINTKNAANLKRAWTIKAAGSTPIFVNNTLYSCVEGIGIAYDPETGAERWKADPTAPGPDGKPVSPRRGKDRCRTIVYWQSKTPVAGAPCQKRIFWGDESNKFYAADANTGQFCRDFGTAKGHPGYVTHLDYDNLGQGVNRSGTPVIAGDLMVGGLYTSDAGINPADGFVRAFDVRTGEMKWEFDPILPEYRNRAGAGNIWSTLSADAARGLVFIGTTSLSNDYYGGSRTFDDPLSDAVVALSMQTGKVVWSRQLVHHDLWDYDIPSHPMLATITKGGKKLDVVIQHTKQGYVFVFDRATGKDVYPTIEKPVPKTTVPGDVSSPTQPTTAMEYGLTKLNRDDVFGINAEDRAACLKDFDAATNGKFLPTSAEKPNIIYPANGGGSNIGSASYDPQTNLLLVRYRNTADFVELRKPPAGSNNPHAYFGIFRRWVSPLGVPCTPPPWTELAAFDMGTGKRAWTRPWGQMVEAKGKPLLGKEEWGTPWSTSGPVITAGGIAFIGASEDSYFSAVDVKTGKTIWREKQELAPFAVPMTYMHKGKQYVAVAASGWAAMGQTVGDIVAYSLGK